MKYSDGREDALPHSHPRRPLRSTFVHRRTPDTDNMQMEHRATAIIYGSYHAARGLMTVRVCVWGLRVRNRRRDKCGRSRVMCNFGGHLYK